MVKQAIQERRKAIRARRVLGIQYRLVKAARKNADMSWGLSTTQDMSTEGLSFYTDREYSKGDILNVHVSMSGIVDLFKGYGQIVRLERKKTGVCFLAAVKFIEREPAAKDSRLNTRSAKNRCSQKRI